MESTVKELVKGYIQKADKKLGVAARLIASQDYEDSVSRSYYAVYHATLGLLLTDAIKVSVFH